MTIVRVKQDFDQKYALEPDPWSIADAETARYDLYRERLLALATSRTSILDIGCGFGAFLARFRDDFQRLVGVEVAGRAVETGRSRFPFIHFHVGSATSLDASGVGEAQYAAIVCSDVIYYLRHDERLRTLDWIADHLQSDGVALIAAYSPGGRYLEPAELRALVDRRFTVLEAHVLESDHVAIYVRRRRTLVALTIDYETWQPIPDGRAIDWSRDVLEPTAGLLDVCDRHGAKLTLFAEMGEYFWLAEHDPAVARAMEDQWREAVLRGHDVQLHLHPNWLPELGARREGEQWHWDWTVGRACDYPGDLTGLIARCCRALEQAIGPVRPGYKVTCFRAGAYEAQPFERLHAALTANGIRCDSSVYAGGRHPDRSYDYRLAYSRNEPYFAARTDPQLKAPPAERDIVEIPVFAPRPNERWTFDSTASERFAETLDEWRSTGAPIARPELHRAARRIRATATAWYASLQRHHTWLNCLLPSAVANQLAAPHVRERLTEDDYFVLIGHSKADLDLAAIGRGLRRLSTTAEFVTLEDMARRARAELERDLRPRTDAIARQQMTTDGADPPAIGSDAHVTHLHNLVPRDRHRMLELDLGRGASASSQQITATMPWTEVVHVRLEDFARLSVAENTFDCVYAENSLEHAHDADATLRAAHAALCDGGVLVAAIRSDARNPSRGCSDHAWKTAPRDVHARLVAAGFADIGISEVDAFRRRGMPPYPPSFDRMMYVRAWKRRPSAGALERALEISTFVHRRLDPATPSDSTDLDELLAGGHAWCAGYVVAAGLMLVAERFDVRWVTLVTDGPSPTGEVPIDTHEVLEIRCDDGRRRVIDPMANVWFDHGIVDLLRDPRLAAPERADDGAHAWSDGSTARDYDTYTTARWYERVVQIAVRSDPRHAQRFVSVEAALRGARLQDPRAVALLRLAGARVVAGWSRSRRTARCRR